VNTRVAGTTGLVALGILVGATYLVTTTDVVPASGYSLSVATSADTYARSDTPARSYGKGMRWSVEGTPKRLRHAFVKFVAPPPPEGSTIASASLRAFSDSASAGAGVNVYQVGSGWTETGLTWDTQPARGAWLALKSEYAAATWVTWNVTAGVPTKGGTVSFELQSTERGWLGFESRENTKQRPAQLVLSYAPVTTTSPTPTAGPTTAGPTTAGPTASPTPTTSPSSSCNVSGQAMPTGDLPGWSRVFSDDFTTNVPIGSFPGSVYGAKWGAYQDGWKDTTGHGTYMPSKVLSVRNCALDYYVHTENGVHLVSAPTPKLPVGAYGKYVVRFRADALHGYKTAWLLWPDSETWPADGEIDWPEGNLDQTMFAAMHYANPAGGQDYFGTSATYPTWHTATTTWEPGKVTFALDGTTFGTSTTQVPTKPMHWVLQTETSTDSGVVPDSATSGHVLIDWVVAYRASTTTSPTPSPTPTSSGGDIVLAAVGDLNPPDNTSTTSNTGLTAASIRAANPAAVALLGDEQYQYGDCSSLVSFLDKTGWGALWPKALPVAGPTHDWGSATDLANYRAHLAGTCAGQTTGASLADRATGRPLGPDSSYAVDLGAWRVVSLSSGLWRYDATAADATTTWLGDALAAAKAAGDHVVAIWHEPYWTSPSSEHPSGTTAERPWVDLLDRYDVPLVLTGHQHAYERFHPQTPPATRNDATGTQQFTVGTGGIGFYCFTSTAANSAARQCNTYGWLKLTLHPDGHYAWQFVRTSGGSFTDSGTR